MTIRSMPPSRAYDEGWDRTFGRRPYAAYERAALEFLGGKPCEVCGVTVLERRVDSQKRLACATCIRDEQLAELKARAAAPFAGEVGPLTRLAAYSPCAEVPKEECVGRLCPECPAFPKSTGRSDARAVQGAATEAPGARGGGDGAGRHCRTCTCGERAGGEAPAHGAADGQAAEVEPGAAAPVGHPGGA